MTKRIRAETLKPGQKVKGQRVMSVRVLDRSVKVGFSDGQRHSISYLRVGELVTVE